MRVEIMERVPDVLIQELLKHTMRLEHKVLQDASDPDEWLMILNEREKLIEQVQDLIKDVTALTKSNIEVIKQIHDINQRLVSMMDDRKAVVQNQLNNIHRSKLAMNTYNESGPNAYGAFLDRKK